VEQSLWERMNQALPETTKQMLRKKMIERHPERTNQIRQETAKESLRDSMKQRL